MPAKIEYYSAMAEDTTAGLTRSREQWTAFLRTAGRMSKYSFEDQMMIFAQRPDATACAAYDLWNDTMRRYVKRGSSGIALIDNSGDYPRLRYVFDVADTGERKNSRDVNLWRLEDEYVRPVQEALSAVFDVSSAASFDVQIENIASWMAIDYWQDHEDEFADMVADSFLEEYDEDNRRMSFLNAATPSIKYEILSRCVENPDDYFEADDFSAIFDYNTRKAVNALGMAVSEVSGQIFREIEITIRSYERSRRMERSRDYGTDLQTERGLPDPEYHTERDQPGAAGQVRQDAPGVPEGTSSDPVQRPVDNRAAVPASEGDRRDGTPEGRSADGGAAAEEPGTGQDEAADGLGAAYEQPESTGRGDRTDRAGLQLTEEAPEPEPERVNDSQAVLSEPVYEQMTLFFPSEAEQIEVIDNAAESEMPSAFSFSQEDIDHVLRLGGRNEHSRQMVAAEFMQGSSLEQIIDVLRIEYRGGQGLLTDHGRLSAWFDGEGIRLAQGDRVQDAAPVQFIPWQEAVARIGELLDEGKYATNVELAETAGHYRSELVQAIWYMRHDFSESAADRQLLPSLEAYLGGGYPAEERRLADALTDPKILADVTRDMGIFSRVYALERGVLRFHYHHIPEMIAGLHALVKPWKEYTSDMAEVPKAGHFITDDEIDEAMSSGSHMAGGKNRIYTFFSEPHSTKEQADFLREEYGTGGFSGAFSNSSYSFMNYEGKGIRLSKEGFAEVTLSWNQAAKRVDSLIRSGRYFTEEAKIEQEQKQEVAAEAVPEVSATEDTKEVTPSTVEEWYEHYLPIVQEAVLLDTVYRNACQNSDRENAMMEGEAAVKRAVISLDDIQLYAFYYDHSDFHNRLTQMVLEETYSRLSEGIYQAEVEKAPGADEKSLDETSQADAEMETMEPSAGDVFSGTVAPEARFHVVEVDWYPGRQAYSIWDDQTGGYYVDADGVTTDFANRWNAEEYRDELMEKAREAAARSSLDRAKDLIDQYCMEEFSVPADFDDMAKIGIGYTTISDEEIPIEASVDLVEFRIERYLNDKLFDIRQYDSLEALISGELEHLEFNELMDATDDEIAESLMENGSSVDWEAAETEQESEDREEQNSGTGERRSVLADLKQKAGQVPPRRESDRSREEAL